MRGNKIHSIVLSMVHSHLIWILNMVLSIFYMDLSREKVTKNVTMSSCWVTLKSFPYWTLHLIPFCCILITWIFLKAVIFKRITVNILRISIICCIFNHQILWDIFYRIFYAWCLLKDWNSAVLCRKSCLFECFDLPNLILMLVGLRAILTFEKVDKFTTFRIAAIPRQNCFVMIRMFW